MPVGNPPGHPPHFRTPEELQNRIDEIESQYASDGYLINMALLSSELGFSSRTSFVDYSKRSPEFSNIIKRAKNKIAGIKIMKAEKNEINATIAIFDAKCNHEFDDKNSDNKESDINVVGFDFEEVKPDER